MTRPRLVLAAALTLAAAPAFAADWKLAGRTFGGNDVFVDAGATRIAGDVRTTWIRVVYARPVDLPAGAARSIEALAHFDCRAGTSAGISVIFYAEPGGGRVLLHGEEETITYGADSEGSFAALARKAICG